MPLQPSALPGMDNELQTSTAHEPSLTSTSSPSPISFLISGGGGNLTSLKGTWRSGCQLQVEEALHINSQIFLLFSLI